MPNLCRGTDLGRLSKVTLQQTGHSVDTMDEVSQHMVERIYLAYNASSYIKKALRQIKFRIDKKRMKKSNKE